MKSSTPSVRRREAASIEPLEARIAPAGVVTRAPGVIPVGDDSHFVHYSTAGFFVDTVTSTDPISTAVGGYHSTDPHFSQHPDETFYISLRAGDSIQNGIDFTKLITVTKGTAVAFFEDRNHDDIVQPSELVAISLGKSATVSTPGALEGSVVGNLTDDGKVDMSDLIATTRTISKLNVGGNIGGSILSGGAISNLHLRTVSGIFAGSAAIGQSFSFFPNLTNGGNLGTGTITSLSPGGVAQLQPAPGVAGAAISVIFADAIQTMKAGDGGFGAAGGALSSIQIVNDNSAFSFSAGKGGAADMASRHLNAGNGGAVISVLVKGFTDATPNDLISIHSGDGGVATGLGLGGAGGAMSSIFIGSSIEGGHITQSRDFVQDDVSIVSGSGGAGKSGGVGGALLGITVVTNTPLDAALAAKNLTHELTVQSGDGGASTDTSTTAKVGSLHAGAGGALNGITIIDQSPEPVPFDNSTSATVLVQAGHGGAVTGTKALGAAGGSIARASLIAPNVLVTAGDGSSGAKGGAGGALTTVRLDRTPTIFVHHAEVNAGNGGNGTVLPGGAGGAIVNLTSAEGDFTSFLVNAAGVLGAGGVTYHSTGGAGGNSTTAAGGKGGAIGNFDIQDGNSQIELSPLGGDFVMDSGNGGNGGTAGGAGGTVVGGQFISLNMNAFVTGGSGGNATVSGNGGAGGGLGQLRLNLDNNVVTTADATHPIAPLASSAQVMAGSGGTGVATGGAGGGVTAVVVRVANTASTDPITPITPAGGGNATVVAGDGGSGGTGAAGIGGTVILSGAYGAVGAGKMAGGNAGPAGSKPAAGGSVRGASATSLSGVYGATDITLTAGNGSNGGAGGNLFFVGYGSTSDQLQPVPTGDIIIRAGDGSAVHPTKGLDYAGAGGSIVNLYGAVTSGVGKLTAISAGHGGAVPLGTKVGAGGSLANINIQRGPIDDAVLAEQARTGMVPAGVLTLAAGDAGDPDGLLGTSASVGANGGSVTGVTIGDIGTQTIFRSISGGDASPGLVRGGAGGSVLSVQTQNQDIGVRTGLAYGYSTMGGIFAGKGGPSSLTVGLAGNVEVINANSISAIAAGKSNIPELANTVAYIKLNTVGFAAALPPDTGTAVTDQIEFTYHPVLVQTSGTAASQTFERVPGGSAQFVQPGGGPTTFTLTFQNQTTVPLDADETASTIQSALNALPAVQQAGGVTVTNPATFPPAFTISFNNPGAAAPITGVGSERTAPLVGNATDAQARAAINALSAVNDGAVGNYPGIPKVTVESPSAASYQIAYADPSAQFGEITAEHLISHPATTTVAGTPTTNAVQHVELYSVGQFKLQYTDTFGNTLSTGLLNVGASPADVSAALQTAGIDATATTSAVNTYDLHFNAAGPVQTVQALEYHDLSSVREASQTGRVTELVHGNGTTAPEVQEFKLDTTTKQFTVQFNDMAGGTTVPLAYGATAQQVQDALNNLNDPNVGTVSVSQTQAQINSGTYDITFGNVNAQPLVTVAEFAHITDVNFTPLRGVNDIVFTVPHVGGADETITVQADKYTSTPVTAAQVETALNTVTSIMTAGGVKVTLTPDHVFHIAFNTPANAEAIHASEVVPSSLDTVTPVGTMAAQVTEVTMGDGMATPEVQDVQLSPGANYFTLKYNDTTTTAPLATATATANDVMTALNNLGSAAAGQVHVTGNVASGFQITYDDPTKNDAPQPLVNVTEMTDQVDQLTVSNLGSFHFVNGATTSPELSPNATAAQVATAINTGLAQPEVSVTMAPGAHGVYLVKYLDGQTHPSMSATVPSVVDTLAVSATAPPAGPDTLTLARPQIFDENIYTQQANLVGAIADLNHLGAEHFAFLDNNHGGAPGAAFELGDTAIDGLIAAKNFSQKTMNFTPQARLIVNSDANSTPLHFLPVDPLHPTSPVFYDFANDLS